LQAAVYGALTTAPEMAGVAVHDALPPDPPETFVLIGPEEARDEGDGTGGGAEHRLAVSVISRAAGFRQGKEIAAAISAVLVDAPLTLAVGTLVSLRFLRASARRLDEGDVRRIDLLFRARVAF
jgi:hypothetical protein